MYKALNFLNVHWEKQEFYKDNTNTRMFQKREEEQIHMFPRI